MFDWWSNQRRGLYQRWLLRVACGCVQLAVGFWGWCLNYEWTRFLSIEGLLPLLNAGLCVMGVWITGALSVASWFSSGASQELKAWYFGICVGCSSFFIFWIIMCTKTPAGVLPSRIGSAQICAAVLVALNAAGAVLAWQLGGRPPLPKRSKQGAGNVPDYESTGSSSA